jgi:hypothetical protein
MFHGVRVTEPTSTFRDGKVYWLVGCPADYYASPVPIFPFKDWVTADRLYKRIKAKFPSVEVEMFQHY